MIHYLMGLPFTLLSFVIALSVVVFVHEFGHFFVARRCGVRCESFSIGFGPELFGWTDRHGTRWKISPIPLGGYVRMAGEGELMHKIEGGPGQSDPGAVTPTEHSLKYSAAGSTKAPVQQDRAGAGMSLGQDRDAVGGSLKDKPLIQRAAIVFAGPAVNFLFAVAVFFVIYLANGRAIVEPVIGSVVPGSAAAEAGLQPDDRIVSIDGTEIKGFDDIERILQLGYGAPMRVTVERQHHELQLTWTPRISVGSDGLGNKQRSPSLDIGPAIDPVVGNVIEGGAAAAAGFQPGDRIVSIDGAEIHSFDQIQRLVQLGSGAPMHITVQRDNTEVQLSVTPRVDERTDAAGKTHRTPLLGIESAPNFGKVERLGPVDAMGAAINQTYSIVQTNLVAFGQMISGRRGTDDLGGPIRIAKYSAEYAKTGPRGFVVFMAILSISLGLLNLFPVPLLDGGHLLFYAIEAVRGRPLSEQAQEWGFRVGVALVGALFIFVTWNDIVRS